MDYLNAIFNCFPHIRIKKTTETCVLPTALSLKDVFSISCASGVVFLSLKQTLLQMHHSFKSAIRKSQSTLKMNNNKHLLTSNTQGYGHKTHYSASEDNDTRVQWQKAVKLALLTPSSEFRKFWMCLHTL
jgi:hypothetical protein